VVKPKKKGGGRGGKGGALKKKGQKKLRIGKKKMKIQGEKIKAGRAGWGMVEGEKKTARPRRMNGTGTKTPPVEKQDVNEMGVPQGEPIGG